MKRYFCSAVAGLVLALASAAPAAASGLPIPGQSNTEQSGTQVSSLGDQSVGEQSNTADITQSQGNGNVNVWPAVSVFGDAETRNEQGNGNTAIAKVDQENEVEQSQASEQEQSLSQSGESKGCCAGQSQTGEQKLYGGDQSVDEQSNDATVDQWQGNGNVNVSPAVSVFGDAETKNEQGNGNVAYADVEQGNEVEQTQTSKQEQTLTQTGGDCCEPRHHDRPECEWKKDGDGKGHGTRPREKPSYDHPRPCKDDRGKEYDDREKPGKGHSGKPSYGTKPRSDDRGHGRRPSYDRSPKCEPKGSQRPSYTGSKPGHGWTRPDDGYDCKPAWQPEKPCDRWECKKDDRRPIEDCHGPKLDHGKPYGGCPRECEQKGDAYRCEPRSEQVGEQKAVFGDQSVGEQSNTADVTQKQGNGNANESPAFSVFHDAETRNEQGNGNVAIAKVDQENEVEQSQVSSQLQTLTQGVTG